MLIPWALVFLKASQIIPVSSRIGFTDLEHRSLVPMLRITDLEHRSLIYNLSFCRPSIIIIPQMPLRIQSTSFESTHETGVLWTHPPCHALKKDSCPRDSLEEKKPSRRWVPRTTPTCPLLAPAHLCVERPDQDRTHGVQAKKQTPCLVPLKCASSFDKWTEWLNFFF